MDNVCECAGALHSALLVFLDFMFGAAKTWLLQSQFVDVLCYYFYFFNSTGCPFVPEIFQPRNQLLSRV